MQRPSIRERAHALIENLPDGASWEDLMDSVYVLQAIDRGLEDSRNGRTLSIAEVRAQFELGQKQ